MSKSNLKTFSKYLLLAQSASDAGKGMRCASAAQNAQSAGYGLKDKYIAQAIDAAKKCSLVRVGVTLDGYLGMQVVLFDIKGYGQVSFHTYSDWGHVKTDSRVEWNGIRGGSLYTCRKLSRRFNLNHYWR